MTAVEAQLELLMSVGIRIRSLVLDGDDATARQLAMLPGARDDGVSVTATYRGALVMVVRDGIERIGLELLHGKGDGE